MHAAGASRSTRRPCQRKRSCAPSEPGGEDQCCTGTMPSIMRLRSREADADSRGRIEAESHDSSVLPSVGIPCGKYLSPLSPSLPPPSVAPRHHRPHYHKALWLTTESGLLPLVVVGGVSPPPPPPPALRPPQDVIARPLGDSVGHT